jgi:hypothetical protein
VYDQDKIVYRPYMTDLISLQKKLAEKVSRTDSAGLSQSDTQLLIDEELSTGTKL